MALDMCIESYGAVVYVLDSLWSSGLHVRGRGPRDRGPEQTASSDFDYQVRSAVQELTFVESQAIWLVDVCGCSYDQAAADMRCSRNDIIDSVRRGRQQIRAGLSVRPAEAPVL